MNRSTQRWADIVPLSPLQSPYNRFKDAAEDIQYQYIADEHIVTAAGTRISESMNLAASFATGSAANASDQLTTTRLWATYYYRRQDPTARVQRTNL